MSRDQLVLLVFGGGAMALIAAAVLLLLGGVDDQEVARRVAGLRQGATVSRRKPSRLLPMLLGMVQGIGLVMRDRRSSSERRSHHSSSYR